jgi:hypothetical protein
MSNGAVSLLKAVNHTPDEIGADQPGAPLIGAVRGPVAVEGRAPPECDECQAEQDDAEDDANQRSGGRRGSERRDESKCTLGEIKGADQHRRPEEPVARGRGRHRQQAKALGAGSEHDAATDQGEPHREDND